MSDGARAAVLAAFVWLLGCAASRAPSSAEAASLAVDVYGSRVSGTDASAPAPVAFRVLAPEADTGSDRVLAAGRTGEGPVRVPAGVVTLAVDLDPPERIGPFRLAAGLAAHVRILDTLEAGMPSRIWRIERGDEVVGRSFPPPDELPERPAR